MGRLVIFTSRLMYMTDADIHSRCLCITKSGRLGCKSKAIAYDDGVEIIALDVPLMLRPCGYDSYILVEVAYIRRVIIGEAVKCQNPLKISVLCGSISDYLSKIK